MYGIQLWVNNPGGLWLLSDKNWKELESAGWEIFWCYLFPKYQKLLDSEKMFKGTPAIGAFMHNTKSVQKARTCFQLVTGLNPDSRNCQCCYPFFEFEYKEY